MTLEGSGSNHDLRSCQYSIIHSHIFYIMIVDCENDALMIESLKLTITKCNYAHMRIKILEKRFEINSGKDFKYPFRFHFQLLEDVVK